MNHHCNKSFFWLFFLVIFGSLHLSFVEPTSELIDDKAKKTRRCQQILKELAVVSGLNSVDLPEIRVVDPLKNQSLAIAMFHDKGQAVIEIENWTYNICTETLGKDSLNGLVFIIAHELVHFIKKHEERHRFQKEIKIDSVDIKDSTIIPQKMIDFFNKSPKDSLIRAFRTMVNRYNIRKNEAEADLHAGFIAYLAGYDIREAAPVFFDTTYKYFKLDTEKGKYVSLEERKAIVEMTSKQLDTLVQIFEMANLLTVSGEYGKAVECYKYVRKHYASPALLNNIGVTMILESLQHFDKDMLRYYLPFTLNTSLVKNNSKGLPSDTSKTNPLVKLNKAIEYFDEVQLRYPKNYEAFLNESIANFLIAIFNKTDDAPDSLNILYAKAAAHKSKNACETGDHSKKALSDIYCMLSIIEHSISNKEQTKHYYNKSKNENELNELLNKNKHIVDNTAVATSFAGSSTNSICDTNELVFGTTTMVNLYDDVNDRWDLSVILKENKLGEKLLFTTKSFDNGKLSNVEVLSNNIVLEFYSVFQTNDLYTMNSACGMKNGMNMERLGPRYGSKPKIIQTRSGSYHNYQLAPFDDGPVTFTRGTNFYSANSGKVDRWFIYEKMTPTNK